MLVQFTFKNFSSFKEEATLDMRAVKAYKEHEYNLIDIGANEKFLKVASLYGANASGKSNFIWAFDTFQNIIRESFNNKDEYESTAIDGGYIPFLFDEKNEQANIEFEIVEIVGSVEYQYGFTYNEKRIVNEWLYKRNLEKKRKIIIFERNGDGSILMGASIKKICEAYVDQIPEDVLILSFFNRLKLKTDVYNDVYQSIMDTFVIKTDFGDKYFKTISNFLPTIIDRDKENLLNYLESIDSGIKNISYEYEENGVDFYTYHCDKHGNEYKTTIEYESEGTLKSLALFIFISTTILGGKSLMIDELNIKLHPLLLKFMVDLYNESDTTAQLIYTTHDTTLLDKKFFRRDQVWFIQKDAEGYSKLYSLADFKIRSDSSFEKEYLGGVYGGIPTLKNFSVKESSINNG